MSLGILNECFTFFYFAFIFSLVIYIYSYISSNFGGLSKLVKEQGARGEREGKERQRKEKGKKEKNGIK